MTSSQRNRVLLMVLDGFGIGKDYPFNAIQNAKMPHYQKLLQSMPHSQLQTHGRAVGLPEGVMGNSEVGHMTLGAGRVIYQDLVRISDSIRDKSFFSNTTLRNTILAGASKTGRVHLMGLLSDGGVHSHVEHLYALIDLCIQLKVPHLYIHAFLDGRDTPPQSGEKYLSELISEISKRHSGGSTTAIQIASVSGRYFAMDRDKRWDRIEKAWTVLSGNAGVSTSISKNPTCLDALRNSYQNGVHDEFVIPTLLVQNGGIQNGDSVLFFNYRSDRARQLSSRILGLSPVDQKNSNHDVSLSGFAGMTVYDAEKIKMPAAFLPQTLNNIFPKILADQKIDQLRIAETEKYAHVTFFFNGGIETPFPGEERILIPSNKEVATYDQKPEMSAHEVTHALVQQILTKKHGFSLVNFANADMVGHTGNYPAAIQAMECLDECIGKVVSAAASAGVSIFLTADHGNVEEMQDCEGRPHTQHTLNPVPALWIPADPINAPIGHRNTMKDGSLADVAPTLIKQMGLIIPHEMTGNSLC